MKSIIKICFLVSIILLILSIVVIRLTIYFDADYIGKGVLINTIAFYGMVISTYLILGCLIYFMIIAVRKVL